MQDKNVFFDDFDDDIIDDSDWDSLDFEDMDFGDDSEWDDLDAFIQKYDQPAPRPAASEQDTPDPSLNNVFEPTAKRPTIHIGSALICLALLLIVALLLVLPIITDKDNDIDISPQPAATEPTETTTNIETEPSLSSTANITLSSSDNPLHDTMYFYQDVMNGSQTEVIGQRGFTYMYKPIIMDMSDEQFAEFAKEVGSLGLKWFTIDFSDGTGIVCSGIMHTIWEYGTIDDLGRIDELHGTAYLQSGHYSYTENPWHNNDETLEDNYVIGEDLANAVLSHNPPYVEDGEITIPRSDFTLIVNALCDDAYLTADIGEYSPNTFAMYGDTVDITISCKDNDNEKIDGIAVTASIGNDDEIQSFTYATTAIMIALYGDNAAEIVSKLIAQVGLGGPANDPQRTIIDGVTYVYSTNDSADWVSLIIC